MRLTPVTVALAALAVAAPVSSSAGGSAAAERGTIVFPSARGGATAIWRVGAQGGEIRRVTRPEPTPAHCGCRSGERDGGAVLSPDGRRVAFTRGARLWLVDVDGRHAAAVEGPAGGEDFGPVWSSRGRLAFVRTTAGGSRQRYLVVSVDARGGTPRILVGPRTAAISDLAWSADGRRLAYVEPYVDPAAGTRLGLFVVRDTGGPPRFLLWAISLSGPAWSPDGRRIAFVANPPADAPFGPNRLFTVSTSGRRIVQLTHGVGERLTEFAPRWAPDGRTIVFSRYVAGVPEVVAIRAGGGRERVLARDAHEPAWSPDGRRIVFVENVRGRSRPLLLSVMDADGTRRRALVVLHRPEDGWDLSSQSWRAPSSVGT